MNTKGNWNDLKDKVRELRMVHEQDEPTEEDIKEYSKFSDENVNYGEGYYSLLRELQGAEYLSAVAKGDVRIWMENNNFVHNSLFCEYAYIIDLDDERIWLCTGFQHKPQKGNPFGTEPYKNSIEDKYYPLK